MAKKFIFSFYCRVVKHGLNLWLFYWLFYWLLYEKGSEETKSLIFVYDNFDSSFDDGVMKFRQKQKW